MKLLRLIKTYLFEIYSKIRIGKNLSENFLIRNDLKEGEALRHCFLTLLSNMPLGRSRKTRWD
jgi:hypothetical protein